jgi:hypothetical protein
METKQDLSRDNQRSGRDINPERPKGPHYCDVRSRYYFAVHTEAGDINEEMKLQRVI